jgi:hypothetical protein
MFAYYSLSLAIGGRFFQALNSRRIFVNQKTLKHVLFMPIDSHEAVLKASLPD